jgi:hypothetical protein
MRSAGCDGSAFQGSISEEGTQESRPIDDADDQAGAMAPFGLRDERNGHITAARTGGLPRNNVKEAP